MWCVYEHVYVWWQHLCACQCVLLRRVNSVYEMDVKAQTSPYPLGWIGLTALNAQSLRSISEKAQHSGSWSGDQMYFCNFFVQWDCWILWTDHSIRVALETVVLNQHLFSSLSLPPAVELQRHIHIHAGSIWKMVNMFPLHHYKFALCNPCNFYPQIQKCLTKMFCVKF